MKKIKKQNKIRMLLISIIILLLLIIVVLLFGLKDNPKLIETPKERVYHNETVMPSYIDDIVVNSRLIPKNSKRRPSKKREIKYIVIHETDNRSTGAGAYKHSLYLYSNNDSINGWHYTVDENEIYHNLPDNELAWHAGDGQSGDGNNFGVGIEMSVNVDGNYDKTLDNTVKLIVYLMHEYDLNIEDVKLHRDFSGKICPHRMITENKVDIFYEKIKKEYFFTYQVNKALNLAK